jgi:hypothetical protein
MVSLIDFEHPDLIWVLFPYMTRKHMGTGRAKFVFTLEADGRKQEVRVDERNILAWDMISDEMEIGRKEAYVTFEAIGKFEDGVYRWMHGNPFGTAIEVTTTTPEGTSRWDQWDLVGIRVKDTEGKPVSFQSIDMYEDHMHAVRKQIKHMCKKHNLVDSDLASDLASVSSASSDGEDSADSEPAEPEKPEAQHVELEKLDWPCIANNMWKELNDMTRIRVVDDRVGQLLQKMAIAMDNKEWDAAIRLAAAIRPAFRFCKFSPEAEDKVWRLNRRILGEDLAHIQDHTDMIELQRYGYMRTTLIPTEVLGGHRSVAQSPENTLVVSKKAHADICAFHKTLMHLMDESQRLGFADGKQVQLEVDTRRILKSSYLPNQIIYKVRGFCNFDKIVDVW